jgi:hypothetical protein
MVAIAGKRMSTAATITLGYAPRGRFIGMRTTIGYASQLCLLCTGRKFKYILPGVFEYGYGVLYIGAFVAM